MRWYAVLRAIYSQYPLRVAKEISKFKRMDENTWSYIAKDIDDKESTFGYIHVFRREDTARRFYDHAKGRDGEGSSLFLVFADSFPKRGAAQRALGGILGVGYKRGELLESYHYEQKGENERRVEADHGHLMRS